MDLQLALHRICRRGAWVNTHGATLEEDRANLQEAVAMVLEANRELIQQTTAGAEVIRERLKFTA